MNIPGSGELKTRIGIRTWDEVPNAQMGSDATYGAPLLVWAKMMPVSGTLYYGSQQVEDTVTHRFIIRTGPDITAKNVIDASGFRYRVKRVNVLGVAPQFTVIEAEELGKVV